MSRNAGNGENGGFGEILLNPPHWLSRRLLGEFFAKPAALIGPLRPPAHCFRLLYSWQNFTKSTMLAESSPLWRNLVNSTIVAESAAFIGLGLGLGKGLGLTKFPQIHHVR